MQLKYSFILAETLWGKKSKHKYWRIRLEILFLLNFGFPLSSPIPNSEISPIYQSEQIFEKYYNFFSQNKFWTNQNNSGLSNGNSELTKLFHEIYIGFWMKLNHWWRWNCHESIECLWSFIKYCTDYLSSSNGFTNILTLRIYEIDCRYLHSHYYTRINKQTQFQEFCFVDS